jgi:hypothetical protein
MKTRAFCILMACVAAVSFAEGSSESAFSGDGQQFGYKNFTSVETGWGIDVTIEQSSTWHVALFADPDLMDHIVVEKIGSTLRIDMRELPFFVRPHGRARVEISMPALEQVKASGGAGVVVRMDAGDNDVRAVLSGGSRLSGTLRCRDLAIDGSGGSSVKVAGSGDTLTLRGSGGTTYAVPDFAVREADIRLSGGSSARISADERIALRASGGSHVVFSGTPSVDKEDLSGGSWIRNE